MKVRSDFVTNSSSTSYCMLGVSGADDMRLVAEALGVAYEEDRGFVEVDYADLRDAGYSNGYLSVAAVFIVSDGNTLYNAGVEIERLLKVGGDMKWSTMKEAAAEILIEFLGREVLPSEIKLLYGEAGSG